MSITRGEYICLACGGLREWRFCGPCNDYIAHRSGRAWCGGKVAHAIRKGFLQPACNFPCADCGSPATDYDHRDYSKPFEIDPVCHACNKRRGPGKPNWMLLPNDGIEHKRRFAMFRVSGYVPGEKRILKLSDLRPDLWERAA